MTTHNVYRAQLDSRTVRPETIEKLSPSGFFVHPMISPDGQSAVFWGREEGTVGFNLWRRDFDASSPVKLTDWQAVTGHPFWSADGKQIVFVSTAGLSDETEWFMKGQFDADRSPRNLWIMNADGTGKRKLTEGEFIDERPCISPNGDLVVFSSNRSGCMNLWSLSISTGELTQIFRHDKLDFRPVFSPTGERLAFFTNNNPQSLHTLCVMDWPNGELSFPLPKDGFKWLRGPFWLADGESMMMHGVAEGEQFCALWILRLADGSFEKITVPGLPAIGHGTMNATRTTLVFDSETDLLA